MVNIKRDSIKMQIVNNFNGKKSNQQYPVERRLESFLHLLIDIKMIKNITVIGAGTMGNGIVQVFASHGYAVTICDILETNLETALQTIANNLERRVKKDIITEAVKQNALKNIITTTQLAKALKDADIVVEAITENVGAKQKLFQQLDIHCKPSCILTSNTSSISITKLGGFTNRPAQVIGMHFMNPVPVMSLVEIISGLLTDVKVKNTIIELVHALEKTPVEANDYPGFVANRILMPMINEAIHTLNDGVAEIQAIDQIMKLGMAHPMGPLELADFIGLDVCLSIMQVLHLDMGEAKYAPCPLLVKMVDAKLLGVKTKQGFYQYIDGSKDKKPSNLFAK